MTREVGHFEALTRELSTRAARATLGQLGLRNDPLREHLRSVFERPAGTPGSFLAEPVFEGIFPWESAEVTMADLAGQLLHPSLVAAMDQPAPALEEQRFPAGRRPYLHQVNAWRVLASDPPRSVVVTSGTGSGKTECFLVPILDSLAREHERSGSALVGTRALFLYPLNALINSQRDRLRAWTWAFGSDIRFCLYNGETPETVPAREQAQLPQQTLSRRLLRESPPPILVTNATMLEYMLVRAQDAPIIHASRGRLRWIVLDEAHSYVGSQAAELALLIRRVMLAFRVQPSDVRFVATSATISTDDEDRTRAELKAFVADIAGIAPEQVAVVDGKRIVPPIAPDWAAQRLGPPAPDELDAMTPEARFERLATAPALRDLREAMARTPLRASAIRERLGINGDSLRDTLRLLDHGTRARTDDGAFLPLRGHLFHRTLRGLWACCNGACPGRQGTHLDAADWPFGALFLERREQCEHCHSPVFDVTVCNGCGVPFLACQEGIDEAHGRHLAARSFDSDYDEFEDELEVLDADLEGADTEPARGVGLHRLLAAPGGDAVLTRIDAATGTLDPDDAGLDVGLIGAEPDGTLRCPSCGAREHIPGNVFRPVRLGAPFYLSVAIPAVLAQTPPIERDGASHPYDGRRLITFSDSRQGTARFAVKAQLDAERSYVRSTLYHQLAAVRPGASPKLSEAEAEELAALRQIRNPAPALRARMKALEAKSEGTETAERLGRLSWNEAAHALQNSEPVRRWLGDQWNELALGAVPANQAARFCLYRELFRRPRRMNSLETLGLGALVYPVVERLQPESRPAEWRSRSLPLDTWMAFLTLALDFYVRAYSAVDIPGEYIRWLGIPVRPVFLIGPDADPPGPRQVRWPLLRGGAARNRLVRLLSVYLVLDPDDPEHAARINAVLRTAWETLRPLFREYDDGLRLNLEEHAHLSELRCGAICPVTRRVLPVTLDGITPYLPPDANPVFTRCESVDMPTLPRAFWREPGGQVWPKEQIVEWLESDPVVTGARERGIWTEFSDRIASSAPYFRVVEHSAQQSGTRLRNYEERFKRGDLNVLSCSTTMEMGVDIGGLAAVGMNNAPPSPANFLQRAGRAGRRGESIATSLTLCKSTPHGEAVFRNPMWPFETPIFVPRVALDSERLVLRHVNSVALAAFLAGLGLQSGSHRLNAGWFFESPDEDQPSPAERSVTWLLRGGNEQARSDVASLVRRSVVDGADPARLLAQSAEKVRDVSERWLREADALVRADADASRDGETETPAQLAIRRQLERLRGEYLLSELAAHGFLPGYGFPTDVVPFVPTTLRELRQRRQEGQPATREDSFAAHRGYPSRELKTAIREYAPGAEVVLDGRVYESAGVTLNWHIPPGDTEVRETQAFRWFWRCTACGATGTQVRRPESCLACHAQNPFVHEFLRPAGFAVDLGYQPHNDINRTAYVPVRDPIVTAGATPWLSLPRPGLGRYRYSADGHLFHWAGGTQGYGFAVCLRCGRAGSEPNRDLSELPLNLVDHDRLRASASAGGSNRCQGNDEDWAIKRGTWLGSEALTDVFELQLRDPATGDPLDDKAAAYSLAVALRTALAERLGINERELGCGTERTTTEEGQPTWSILLFDTATGGAGYVSAVADGFATLLRCARGKLECPAQCDAACHACLLSFDTEHKADDLDRHRARAVLTDELLLSFRLPSDLLAFGPRTQLEALDLVTALQRTLQRPGFDRLRLFLRGNPDDWDLVEWPLRADLMRWSADGIRIEIVTSPEHLTTLDTAVLHSMASLVEAAGIDVYTPSVGAARSLVRPIAEAASATETVQWAVSDDSSRAPQASWANRAPGILCVKAHSVVPMETLPNAERIDAGQLRRPYPGTIIEVSIRTELDGPISSFGTRFWQAVRQQAAPLDSLFERDLPLARVEYTDRYLKSPFALRMIAELLRSVVNATGTSDSPLLVVRTATYPPSNRASSSFIHDWPVDDQRDRIAVALVKLFGDQSVFASEPRSILPHARELLLTWTDDASCILRLDQGVGYWQPQRRTAFPFDADVEHQLRQLAKTEFRVQGAAAYSTIVYLNAPSP